MFIQGLTRGTGDVCSYRALHVGLVMCVHTGPLLVMCVHTGTGDVCSYRALHVGLVMCVHTGPYMWDW